MGEEFVFQVLSLCNHKNKKIKKFALKIFDNWDDVETLPLLVGTTVLRESWLESYRQSTLIYLYAAGTHKLVRFKEIGSVDRIWLLRSGKN